MKRATTLLLLVALAAGSCECGKSPFGLDARPANPTCRALDRPVLDSAVDVVEPWPSLVLVSPLLMIEEPASPAGDGSGRMYVIERRGRIQRFDKSDTAVTVPEEFADLSARVETLDSPSDERGLLGMAFHPDWPDVEEIYLSYSGLDGDGALIDRVSRFGLRGDGLLDDASEQILFEIPSEQSNHNGGMIAFSPVDPCRSCLYYGTGDGGGARDPIGNGQNPGKLLAKMLRVDVDAGDPYGIPVDNPFVDVAGFAPETWAWGFRNPWRFSFDRATGELWVGDVGQGDREEVDVVEARGNYGWSAFEGLRCLDDPQCELGGFEEPIVEYQHTDGRTCMIGGYVYRGAAIPSLAGTYLYADHATGEVFALFFDDEGRASPRIVLDRSHRIASFAEDSDGEIYIIDHEGDAILRVVAAGGAPAVDTFPTLLSQTGCDDTAPGLIPYAPAHELYSDGATKARFMALPDGERATILDDGDIDFPEGTVFRKDFSIAGERVETRLFMRHDDGEWGGYSFAWRGADAALVPPGGETRLLSNGQLWSFPSRNACLACHSIAARRVLGLEIPQLNVDFAYPDDRTANQLATLDHIGVFDGPLPAPVEELSSFPAVDDDDAPLDDVARAYLHVNCSTCHRPGGGNIGETDWRATTAFTAMALCDEEAKEGDLDVPGARVLVPGSPETSLVSIRMKRLGAGRMPLVGSNIVDERGLSVIDRWIESLESCD